MAPPLPQKPGPEAPLPSDSISAEVVDLQQKLSILQQKRQEDKTKIKELEKYRAQLQQVCPFSFMTKRGGVLAPL